MDKLATIEGILSGMKTRIAGIEKTVVAQLDKTKRYQTPDDAAAVQKADADTAEGQTQQESAGDVSVKGAVSLSLPAQQ